MRNLAPIGPLLLLPLLSLGGLTSCDSSSGKAAEAAPPINLRIGHVMVEVGHRFETAGRAAEAERWGLAEYETHEILEMFEDDMSRALLPGACNDEIAEAMYDTLYDEQLRTLRGAAREHDTEAFGEAYAAVAASCNGCHGACEVGFVEVPIEPGFDVPRITATREAPSLVEEAGADEPPAEDGVEAEDRLPEDRLPEDRQERSE